MYADGLGTVLMYPSLGSAAWTLSGSIGGPAMLRVGIPGKPVSVTATTLSDGGAASVTRPENEVSAISAEGRFVS